jgi:hypothetical protein
VSKLSRLEIAVKTVGVTGLLLGAAVVLYTLLLFYGELPESKYLMTAGIMFGGFLCYIGYVSIYFRERESGLYVYETDI